MHEPLPERIRVLELSVQRWRLVSFALMLLVVSFMAIGGTFGLFFVLNNDHRREIEMLRIDAEAAREQSHRALRDAEVARQQLLMEKNNGVPRGEGDVDP
jgi:hypothetical protein